MEGVEKKNLFYLYQWYFRSDHLQEPKRGNSVNRLCSKRIATKCMEMIRKPVEFPNSRSFCLVVEADRVCVKRKYSDSHCLYVLLLVANLEFQPFFFLLCLDHAKLTFLFEIDEFAEHGRI